MPDNKPKLGPRQAETDAKERERVTIREIKKVLDHHPVRWMCLQSQKLSSVHSDGRICRST